MPLTPKKLETFDSFLKGFADRLPPEKYAALSQIFADPAVAEQAVDYTAQHVMLRADYNTNNAELNRQRAEFEAQRQAAQVDIARIAEYDRDLQSWEQHLRTNTVPVEQWNAAQAEVARLQAFKAQAEGRLQELGLTELLDSGTGTGGIQPPAQPQPTNGGHMPQHTNGNNNHQNGNGHTQPGSPQRFVTETQLRQQIDQSSLAGPVLAAQLMAIAQEHQSLTGKPLANPDQLIMQAIQSGKPLKEYADEFLGLPALRAEAAKASYEAEITKRVNEQVQKLTSEQRLPGMAPRDYSQSPIMEQLVGAQAANSNDTLGKPAQRAGEATRRAVEATIAGKYRDQRV